MPMSSGNPVKNWFVEEYAWIGFIATAMIGGFVGWLKAYEQSDHEVPLRIKLYGIARRVLMAGFAGWMIYQITIIYTISNAWGHVLSGIVGMFAAEFFELLWNVVKARLAAMSGKDLDPWKGKEK